MKTLERVEQQRRSNLKFGDLVYLARKKKGYTLQEVSELSNGFLSPSYINRLEKKDKENPAFAVVCELCHILDINLIEVIRSFGYVDYFHFNHQEVYIRRIEEVDDLEIKVEKCIEEIFGLVRMYVYCDEDEMFGIIPHVIDRMEQLRKMIVDSKNEEKKQTPIQIKLHK